MKKIQAISGSQFTAHTVIKTSVSALTGQQAEEPPHNIELEEII